MKTLSIFIISSLLAFGLPCLAQNVTFSFDNAQNTNNGGTNYYEVDVMIATNTPFKLGSGQLYINYNSAAFGTNIFANNKVQMSSPNTGYILSQKDNWLGIVNVYGSLTENDNTDSRYSILWQQSKEGDCINTNVTATPTQLFHLRIEYQNINELPGICFESSALFTGQIFTHCGPNDGTCGLDDENCGVDAGSQINNEVFLCPGALLPLELLQFNASKENESTVHLEWITTNEINTSHFEIERSMNGAEWHQLGNVTAAGHSNSPLVYDFVDDQINIGDVSLTQLYYRLKMSDLDGSFEYSDLRSISFSQQAKLNIYPNPTSWGVNISGGNILADTSGLSVNIYGLDGRLFISAQIDGIDGVIHFPDTMQAGVYQLIIGTDQGVEVLAKRVVLVR